MKCWCNYKKEALFLFLLMRVTLVSAWTGVMESQNTHCTPAPLLSNTLSLSVRCTSPSITFSNLPWCYKKSSEVSWTCAFIFVQTSFEIPWLFVYFGDGGAAVALRGLFIIPLTSWIRAGIIIPSMNIHGLRIYERARETVRQKQTEGQSHKHSSTYSHTVKEQIPCNHDDFNHQKKPTKCSHAIIISVGKVFFLDFIGCRLWVVTLLKIL